jgi:hypothetical protein
MNSWRFSCVMFAKETIANWNIAVIVWKNVKHFSIHSTTTNYQVLKSFIKLFKIEILLINERYYY